MKKQLLLFTLTIINLTNYAQAPRSLVIELLEKSGSKDNISNIEINIAPVIEQYRSKFTNEKDFENFKNIYHKYINSEALLENVIQYQTKHADEKQLEKVLKQYNKNKLLQKVSKIEAKASSKKSIKELELFSQNLEKNLELEEMLRRLVALKLLDEEISASKNIVSLQKNILTSVMKSAVLSEDHRDNHTELSKIDELIEQQFTQEAENKVRMSILNLWLFTYKDLKTSKLEKYVKLWSKPELQYQCKLSLESIENAFIKQYTKLIDELKVTTKSDETISI